MGKYSTRVLMGVKGILSPIWGLGTGDWVGADMLS